METLINMARKKYLLPAPVYKQVCMQINPNDNIKCDNDFYWAIVNAQLSWPSYIKAQYYFESTDKLDKQWGRILKFLERGADWALMYRRCHCGYSWVILDEYGYADLCNSLGIAKDYVLLERNSGFYQLVLRQTPPVIEVQLKNAESDNKPMTPYSTEVN
jgi:hypothetical protein